MNDLISRQGMVEAIDKHIDTFDAIDANYLDGLRTAMSLLNDLPSAQPELYCAPQLEILDDGTLMMTVPQGMLEKVKRVMVDEVGTKNCKVMYQDEPERKKSTWTKDASCPFCGFKPWYERDIHTLSFCPNCGADMKGEQNEIN